MKYFTGFFCVSLWFAYIGLSIASALTDIGLAYHASRRRKASMYGGRAKAPWRRQVRAMGARAPLDHKP